MNTATTQQEETKIKTCNHCLSTVFKFVESVHHKGHYKDWCQKCNRMQSISKEEYDSSVAITAEATTTTKISKQEKNNHPMIVQYFEELNKKYNTDLTPGSSPKTTACLYEELEARGIIEQDKQNEIVKNSGGSFQKVIGNSDIILSFSDKNKMNDVDKLEFATEFFKRCELSLEWELKEYYYGTLKIVNPCYVSVRVNALKKSTHSTSYFTMKNNESAICGQIRLSGYKGSSHKILVKSEVAN